MDIDFLRTDAIQILDNRQRNTLDENHIKSLAMDILENGLIHPLTLTYDNTLVAGYCRLTAIRGLTGDYVFGNTTVPRGHVPVVRLAKARTALDLYKVEFSENEKRSGLSPVERSAALAHLHRNLEAVAGGKGEGWTKQDTAAEVVKLEGGSPSATRQNVVAMEVSDAILIDSFKDDPEVAAAPTRAAAVKIAKKRLEQQFTQMLGAKVVASQGDASVLNDSYRVFHGDFRTFPLEPESYHGIICDPPYGMDADNFGDQAFAGGHGYDDKRDAALEIAHAIFRLGFVAVKPGGHMYLFCAIREWPGLRASAVEAGWDAYPTPLMWHKGFGHAPQVGFFARHYECVLFAAKGMTRRLTKTAGDVFQFHGVRTDKLHAAQKPDELIAEFMKLSFFPGERIVDFTCGSGTIFRAAAVAGMRADGFEKEEKYFHLCKQTIAGLLKAEAPAHPASNDSISGGLLDEEDEEE